LTPKNKYKIFFTIEKVQERLKAFIDGHEHGHICAYHEVKKNEELVTITLLRTEKEQEEIDKKIEENPDFIKEITVPQVFKINDQISLLQKSNKEFVYVSSEPGLVRFSPDSLSLFEGTPTLTESIGAITGDIEYSGSIICREHILNSTKVTTGGNLTVTKSVEDHVKIRCKGNLEIGWGATGKNTVIHCQKNCSIGFIEKCLLVCEGEVEIKTHLYMAKIFCRDHVKVLGVGVTSKKRGAVVGGIINALNSMLLKSVGAEGCPTKLIAGIDLRIQTQLNEANELNAAMERKVLGAQKEIEVFISAAGSAESLGKMSSNAKTAIREQLLALKVEQKSLQELQGKIKKLDAMLYSKDLKNTYISFQDFMDPIIHLQIKEQEETHKARIPGMSRFKLVNNEITKVL
jgi:uncharacterized protein (DUF342 family)